MKTETEPRPRPRQAARRLGTPALAAYEGGASTETLPAADALAWSLLGLLLFCTVCFLFSAWILKRRWEQVQRDLHPDEPEDGGRPAKYPLIGGSPDGDGSPAPPWEKDPNWWKQ